MKKISICIPTYEMNGKGEAMLKRNLDILISQTFKDFEVIISDNSENNDIKNLCESQSYENLDIKYFKNKRKGMAQNTNEAIRNATGEIIKILYMDDYLASNESIDKIVKNFKEYWIATGCEHDDGEKIYNKHIPSYNEKIFLGKNTIGSPSVIAFLNKDILFFDEKMTWLLDCDYYKRLYDKYGKPGIIEDNLVIIGTGNHQTTSILSIKRKIKEHFYMIKKYKKDLYNLFKIC